MLWLVPSAVLSHRRHADARVASVVAHLGAGDLSDPCFLQRTFRREARRNAWRLLFDRLVPRPSHPRDDERSRSASLRRRRTRRNVRRRPAAQESCWRSSPPHKSGRGPRRPLVLVAAQRGGTVVAKTIPTHSRAAIRDALNGLLSPDATVMTDGLPAYKQFGRDRQHLAVTHSAREYARTDTATGRRVHVNRVESFNSLLRRAIIGVWRWISAKHLQRYAGETTFRSNHGDEACLDRMARLIRNGDGNRLPYAELVEAA